MKYLIYLFLATTLIAGAYIASNLIRQNRSEKQFICDCRNSKTISGSFFLDLYYEPVFIEAMTIKLNQKDILVDPTKIRGDKQPYLYEYADRFGISDTVTISIANKKYVISDFTADTVIINAKKGMECRLKSARINNIVQNDNRYKIL